jgi:hypothetical protein
MSAHKVCIKCLDATMTYCLCKLGQTTARQFGHAVGSAVGATRLIVPIPWYPHVILGEASMVAVDLARAYDRSYNRIIG